MLVVVMKMGEGWLIVFDGGNENGTANGKQEMKQLKLIAFKLRWPYPDPMTIIMTP